MNAHIFFYLYMYIYIRINFQTLFDSCKFIRIIHFKLMTYFREFFKASGDRLGRRTLTTKVESLFYT